MFDARELGLLARGLAAPGRGCPPARSLIGEAADPEGPDAPGLVVLGDDWSVESATPGVERWLAELPDGDWAAAERLPPAVLAVAGRALRRAPSGRDAPGRGRVRPRADGVRPLGRPARRVAGVGRRDPHRRHRRARPPGAHRPPADGRLRAHRPRAGGHAAGAPGRVDDGDRRAAVRLAPHGPAAPEGHLREDRGPQPARAGGKVFFAHYEPRVRDNERRAAEGRPARGGPAADPALSPEAPPGAPGPPPAPPG